MRTLPSPPPPHLGGHPPSAHTFDSPRSGGVWGKKKGSPGVGTDGTPIPTQLQRIQLRRDCNLKAKVDLKEVKTQVGKNSLQAMARPAKLIEAHFLGPRR